MNKPTLGSAIPILASLNISRTIRFYCTVLGFTKIHEEPSVYGVVQRDSVEIHFWACSEKYIAENTACRIKVEGVNFLYDELKPKGIIHEKAHLQTKPWGTREFGIVDEDGNLITFFEVVPQPG